MIRCAYLNERIFPGLVFVFAAALSDASAFDTGHHFDLTAAVLREKGFDQTAIQTAQLANWLTDYYSNVGPDEIQKECQKLHFDNLYSTKDVTWYWQQITHNALTATRHAASQDDAFEMLSVFGVAAHAVQDFYSHSNWVETHPRGRGGPYRADTWWSSGAPVNAQLTTGKYKPYPKPPPSNVPEHGGYESGLNKDSYVRPRWDEAYVFAYCACHELAAQMEVWAEQARPGFWNQVKKLSVSAADRSALEKDLLSAYKISLWVAGRGEADGHWKGNHSGSTAEFLLAGGKFMARPNSTFVNQFRTKKVHERLSHALYGNSPPPQAPRVPAFDIRRNVVVLRTLKVEEDKVRRLEQSIDIGSPADFYARITLDGNPYIERTLQNRSSFNEPWTTIHFLDATRSTIPALVQIMDEDSDADDVCDVHPKEGKKTLAFQYDLTNGSLSGDVNGRHATSAAAVTIGGKYPDKDRAIIRFFVTHTPLR